MWWCNKVCLKNIEESAQEVICSFIHPSLKYLLSVYLLSDIILHVCMLGCFSPTLCDPMGYSLGKDAGVGCHALLQDIVPMQGLNPHLLHLRQILYH